MPLLPVNRRQFVGFSAASSLSIAASRIAIPELGQIGKVRVAIIGLGERGQRHCQRLAQRKDVQIHLLCDSDARAIERVVRTDRQRFQDQVALAHSLEEVVQSSNIDAAVVALPSSIRGNAVHQLTAAGIPVLVESPLLSADRNLFRLLSPSAHLVHVTNAALREGPVVSDDRARFEFVQIDLTTIVSDRAAARRIGNPRSMQKRLQDPQLLAAMRDESVGPLLRAWKMIGRPTLQSVDAIRGTSYPAYGRSSDARVSYRFESDDVARKRIEIAITTAITDVAAAESTDQPVRNSCRMIAAGKHGQTTSDEFFNDLHVADYNTVEWESAYSRFANAIRGVREADHERDFRDSIAAGELLRLGRAALQALSPTATQS